MTREQIIEAMARAQYASEPHSSFWLLNDHRTMCDAALSAIEALGYVVVPREATEYMIDIGACHEDQDHDIFDEGHIATEVYRAMIEAGKV